MTVAKRKPVIRACPATSTRIFGWTRVNGITGRGTITHPLEIAMNYVVGVEEMKALGNTG